MKMFADSSASRASQDGIGQLLAGDRAYHALSQQELYELTRRSEAEAKSSRAGDYNPFVKLFVGVVFCLAGAITLLAVRWSQRGKKGPAFLVGSSTRADDSAFPSPSDLFVTGNIDVQCEAARNTVETDVVKWLVVHRALSVVSHPAESDGDDSATTLGVKKELCEVFTGRRKGAWVKLDGPPGYLKLCDGHQDLISPLPVYKIVENGTCEHAGLFPILNLEWCEMAAEALGFSAIVPSRSIYSPSPYGCYQTNGKTLWLSNSSSNQGNGAIDCRHLLCSSHKWQNAECMNGVRSSSLNQPQASSVERKWGWPSFFCFLVMGSTGFEPKLVQEQFGRHAGIFACDEYIAFSHDGTVVLGKNFSTTPVSAPQAQKQDYNWLNVAIFQKAWSLVGADGRWYAHDWIAKADPDAVFFPDRLRGYLREQWQAASTGSWYFQNCDKYGGSAKLFGSVEVFSHDAVASFVGGGYQGCEDSLDWHGWGEDMYIQLCMEKLGAKPIQAAGMISDSRCEHTTCSDKKKISFHSFQDVNSWVACWNQSMQ